MTRPLPPFRSRSLTPFLIALAVLVFALVSAPALEAQFRGFGKNKVRYDKFDWLIYHSPHFDVYYYPEEEHFLEKVVSFAESAYDQLSRELDFQIQEATPLIFYSSHNEFEQNNIILNFIPEGVAAFASPARNRMVMPVDMPDPVLYKLLLHELTHIFQYHILFQGSLSRAATARPPQWLMEGMASYMADDEDGYAKMVLRDAVVNDLIPSVAEGNPSGYFAYRFGHAVFDFIEERWGKEGFRDFIYEFRNTLGARPGRAIERAFRMDPEDFDVEFRRWLRQKYLQQLIDRGEPSDFGRPFRVDSAPGSNETSAVASPSGDLVAAFSVQRGDIDIVLFDAKTRRQIRNLTRGLSTRYEYLVVQTFTVGRRMGRDLAFSPDGNYLAAFARRNSGRVLMLFDVLKGGLAREISMDLDQQIGLAWSPDGKTIAFAGAKEGVFDIYLLDVESGEVRPLTQDPIFDGGPAFSPDGKSMVISSDVGGQTKLFRVDLANPSQRYQLTTGDSADRDAIYSPDGKRIYFTSERDGYDNVFALDLATNELRQYTNVVTGCSLPAVLPQPDGRESLVFTGTWNSQSKLYLTDLEEPVGEPQKAETAETPVAPGDLPKFEPAIEVAIDEANKDKYGGYRFFLTDAQTAFGVDDNQTLLGTIYLNFSDYLGDKQITAILSSYDALSNFYVAYNDLSKRLQKGVAIFDDRDFLFVAQDADTGQILDRRGEIRITGAAAQLSYPLSLSTRIDGSLGYVFRKFPIQQFVPGGGVVLGEVKDDFPFLTLALVKDKAIYANWGPVKGHRFRLDAYYAPDFDNSGALMTEISGDFRLYAPTTLRSGFAFRLFAGARDGNQPSPFAIGGESIRGFDFRQLPGTHAAFATAEYRFPLIENLALPVLRFQGIRGRVFLDVGAVWYDEFDLAFFFDANGDLTLRDFKFWNSDENRLETGVASYGFGFSVNFIGLDLNWDFSKRWDGDSTLGDTEVTFIIGTRF